MNCRKTAIITVFAAALMITGCENYLPFSETGDSEQVIVTAPEFSLQWEYDTSAFSNEDLDDLLFTVFYRKKHRESWQILGYTGYSPILSFEVNEELLEPGYYVFAVSAKGILGTSGKHSSEDLDAIPTGGWHVYWNPSR